VSVGKATTFEGTVLRGKYQVERVLGEGGMGVVLAGSHLVLKQQVAIKLLQPGIASRPDLVERFLREARAASRIESEHVVRVMDVDTLDDGTPFMVMEYLDGADLSSVRRSGQPLPIGDAIAYVLQACEALAEAHGLGIVHRDLKPANLFLARRRDGRSRVKVLDFGISKISEPGQAEVELTTTAMVAGSPQYMSPEQMLSTKDVDGRTDIWALGIVLFELCTARVPWPASTITQATALVMSTPPPPLGELVPGVPAALEAIILRCLEKDRTNRFATVENLAQALEAVARELQTNPRQARRAGEVTEILPSDVRTSHTADPAVRPPVAANGSSTTGGISQNEAPRPVAAPRLSRGAIGVVAAAALAGVVGATLLAQHTSTTRTPAPPASVTVEPVPQGASPPSPRSGATEPREPPPDRPAASPPVATAAVASASAAAKPEGSTALSLAPSPAHAKTASVAARPQPPAPPPAPPRHKPTSDGID
jgi:serine/threonine-protein kinase